MDKSAANADGASGSAMNRRCIPSAAKALWYEGGGQAVLRTEALSPPQTGEALVRTRYSLVSRGTERLVFTGAVPKSEWGRMRAPLQAGDFPFPVKYGYAAVGDVVDGPDELSGRTVFALHPHQDHFVAAQSWLVPVPESVPARRAVLAANMETALNAVWDGGVLPGQQIVIVGAGIVGLLVAYLCALVPGTAVTIADILPERRQLAEAFGARFCPPDALPANADLVFHSSAHPAGLNAAIAAAGHEATIVELSWYGEKRVEIGLGDHFHAGRLKLISSQVGHVSPAMRARWTHRRRIEKALTLLADPRLDLLLDQEIAFAHMPAACPALFAPSAPGLTALIVYSQT